MIFMKKILNLNIFMMSLTFCVTHNMFAFNDASESDEDSQKATESMQRLDDSSLNSQCNLNNSTFSNLNLDQNKNLDDLANQNSLNDEPKQNTINMTPIHRTPLRQNNTLNFSQNSEIPHIQLQTPQRNRHIYHQSTQKKRTYSAHLYPAQEQYYSAPKFNSQSQFEDFDYQPSYQLVPRNYHFQRGLYQNDLDSSIQSHESIVTAGCMPNAGYPNHAYQNYNRYPMQDFSYFNSEQRLQELYEKIDNCLNKQANYCLNKQANSKINMERVNVLQGNIKSNVNACLNELRRSRTANKKNDILTKYGEILKSDVANLSYELNQKIIMPTTNSEEDITNFYQKVENQVQEFLKKQD